MTPIEEAYFNWLCGKVLSQDSHNRNYYGLMEILYRTEFEFYIEMDGNRAADGCELRIYFSNEAGVERDPSWFDAPVSVLEVLIAFANRGSFQTDEPVERWFWRFLNNLGLDDYRRVSNRDKHHIHEILNRWMRRQYNANGEDGGILPIRNPRRDQRDQELWVQMSDYIYENQLV